MWRATLSRYTSRLPLSPLFRSSSSEHGKRGCWNGKAGDALNLGYSGENFDEIVGDALSIKDEEGKKKNSTAREMADLFHNYKQAKNYVEARPSYPEELFQFIGSKTPNHDLAWDVGTGSGQAARSLAGIYKEVVGTDTSQKQLDFAPNLSNVRYQCTPPNLSMAELESIVAGESSVDLVIVAQALHWLDLPTFYHQVKWVLKKPHGVIAAWCYTIPDVNDAVDSVFRPFYEDSKPFWDPARKLVDDKYRGIEFPFEPVDGADHTGPFEFKTERLMDLEGFFTYIRSWSAYHTAKEKGGELLRDDVVENFKRAWTGDGAVQKVVMFPVHLRIGKVGNLE